MLPVHLNAVLSDTCCRSVPLAAGETADVFPISTTWKAFSSVVVAVYFFAAGAI